MTLVIYFKIFGRMEAWLYEGSLPLDDVLAALPTMKHVAGWRLF